MKAQVLNVFCNADNLFGNPVGIVDQADQMSAETRQRVATGLGFSETVFVLNAAQAQIAIHNPQQEIAFSGHAAVGAAWFLTQMLNINLEEMTGRDGQIEAWNEGEITWVRTDLGDTPPWWHERIETVAALESLEGPQSAKQLYTQLWAWSDEAAGLIRSRTFAPAWGIPEDEANGSGCMRLAAALGRDITVLHGQGSVIHARLRLPGTAEAGGRVASVGAVDISPWT